LWRPVCPINLGVEAEYRKACPGQDNEVDNDLRASGSEFAVANRCRGALIATTRAVEIGADGHMASNTLTEGSDRDRDEVRRVTRPREDYYALLCDTRSDTLPCRL
jgi:hypothetical protein